MEYRVDEAAGKGSQIQSVLPEERSRCFENAMPLFTVIVHVCNMLKMCVCQEHVRVVKMLKSLL